MAVELREQVIAEVNTLLQEYARKQSEQAAKYDFSYQRFWQNIEAYLEGGGKRLRPYLVVLAYRAYGGKQARRIIPIAAAWELLHACLLVHDDIIDRDYERHGKPNIAGMYRDLYGSHTDALHYANSSAMLAGDVVLAAAYELVAAAEIPTKKALLTIKLLSEAMFGVAGGELLDIEGAMQEIAEVNTYKIAELKTAEYSFYYPLRCGAMLANSPAKQLDLLHEFSKSVGLGFQLVDDLLGVFGDPKHTGKSIEGDIRERKRTVLIKKAVEMSKPADAKRLKVFMNQAGEPSAVTLEEMRKIIENSGAKQAVESDIEACRKSALKIINKLTISPEYREAFREGVRLSLDRQC